MNLNRKRVVGVSLKMYFGLTDSRAWLEAVADMVRRTGLAERVELFVVPGFVSLSAAREVLAGTGVGYGAQDVFWEDSGPYTGEVSGPTLREAGCEYVEVGHAERRHLFGEDEFVLVRKAAAVCRAGMTPIICVGEVEQGSVDQAVHECVAQARPLLEAVPAVAELLLAYEPVWAIGAECPAEPGRIRAVARGLGEMSARRAARTRIVYGGSAGPGLYQQIASCVDGLFLGRAAHDVDQLRAVLAEVCDEQGASAIGPPDALSVGTVRGKDARGPLET
jgi:triosephosphate isomerase